MNGGFLENPKLNPVGLGLVIAGHAALLTAIALAPPDMVPRIFHLPLPVDSIRDDPPPPPPPLPKEPSKPRATPTTPERIVTTLSDQIVRFDPPPIPPQQIAPIRPAQAEPIFVPATIEPGAMARFQPEYPSTLVRAEIEGSATVRVLIGSDGRVKSVEMVDATDPAFFEATRRQALRAWLFKPATRDGIAAESWRTMTVKFTLTS